MNREQRYSDPSSGLVCMLTSGVEGLVDDGPVVATRAGFCMLCKTGMSELTIRVGRSAAVKGRARLADSSEVESSLMG